MIKKRGTIRTRGVPRLNRVDSVQAGVVRLSKDGEDGLFTVNKDTTTLAHMALINCG